LCCLIASHMHVAVNKCHKGRLDKLFWTSPWFSSLTRPAGRRDNHFGRGSIPKAFANC
jgi:hypothetical protein